MNVFFFNRDFMGVTFQNGVPATLCIFLTHTFPVKSSWKLLLSIFQFSNFKFNFLNKTRIFDNTNPMGKKISKNAAAATVLILFFHQTFLHTPAEQSSKKDFPILKCQIYFLKN